MIKLNLGSGENKIEGFVNVDAEPLTSPDLCLDFRYEKLPYEENTVDEIWILHCIEHVERRYWDDLFKHLRTILKPQGLFVLSYPEFSVCADNFITNRNDNREFWHATLYGRQLYGTDYHVTAIDTPELKQILFSHGFYGINSKPEVGQAFNTTLVCRKSPPELMVDKEKILVKEMGLK